MTTYAPPAPTTPSVDLAEVVATKAGNRVAVCIPARDEAETVARVVDVTDRLRRAGLVDELVVIDDGSLDETSVVAAAAGATVVPSVHGPGKGQALRRGVAATTAEVIVFLDADVSNFEPHFVTHLVAPLLTDPTLQMVKATYRRPLRGVAGEGGRVTEILARPLLHRFFPELATLVQPLAGECAIRRSALEDIGLHDGYGIEIALLIDVYRRHGRTAITEADLGERVHRNRPLFQLRAHADSILAAVLERIDTIDSIDRGEHP